MFNSTLEYVKFHANRLLAKVWLFLQLDRNLAIAETLFHVNHYAMQHKHSEESRAIYDLKNKIIETFYRTAKVIGVTKQVQKFGCWTCDGTGEYYTGQECWKCDGTGVYRSVFLFRFMFLIGNRTFIWHQPEPLVKFPVVLSEEYVADYHERAGAEFPTAYDVHQAIARLSAFAPGIVKTRSLMESINCDLFDIETAWRDWVGDLRYWLKNRKNRGKPFIPQPDPDCDIYYPPDDYEPSEDEQEQSAREEYAETHGRCDGCGEEYGDGWTNCTCPCVQDKAYSES